MLLYYSNSNWASICVQSYEPEIVHDIVDSDDQCYDEDEDSNGEE